RSSGGACPARTNPVTNRSPSKAGLQMGSTVRSSTQRGEAETSAPATIRWRSWPLADDWHWSWLLIAGMLGIGAVAGWLGGGWILGVVIVVSLGVALWQFLLPVTFELCSLGVRRYALGRMRLVPWQAIRAYHLRATGVVFFQQPDPTTIDLLRSLFVPYPADEDEMVVALRLYLPHATEIP
ncbi:MAG TPA: hypothetical protein VFW73_10815, partial [Lacipirellulaceae bacterium]|nr:hypothetical protein [Lacipirellulaceae bacterium]